MVVNEILSNPSIYGRWRYVKKTRRIKWELDIKRIYNEFYELLKLKGLPPKFALSCMREASFITKSVLNNENNWDKKCVIRSYRARCDYQAYKIELRGNRCYLKLRNFGEIKVKGFSRKWFDTKIGNLEI